MCPGAAQWEMELTEILFGYNLQQFNITNMMLQYNIIMHSKKLTKFNGME